LPELDHKDDQIEDDVGYVDYAVESLEVNNSHVLD